VVAEAEGGEIILARGVARDPALFALASQLNELGGGVRLSPQATYPRMAAGGIVPTELQPSGAGSTPALLAAIERLAERPTVVSVEEIRTVESRLQVLERNAVL
jgi:hypothetical protein